MKKAKKSVSVKLLLVLLSVVLVVGCAIGGTLAWLTAETPEIVNTFTDSNVKINLAETKNDFKMIPGYTIDKDPVVTVLANSEACWLFVEVTESETPALKDYIDYEVISDDPDTDEVEGWTQGDGTNIPANVYYREVTKSDSDQAFPILVDNKVTVLETVTQEMMDAITNADGMTGELNQPTLTFQAYAIQLYSTNGTEFTAAAAWAKIKPATP